MKRTTILFLGILGILLVGCGPKTESGNINKRYAFPEINNTGDGFVFISVKLEAESTAQLESGDASSTMDPKTAFGYQGGTGTIADEGAELLQEGFTDLYRQWIDMRKRDSENPVTTTTTTTETPVVQPTNPGGFPPDLGNLCERDFDVEMVMTYQQPDGDHGFWFTGTDMEIVYAGDRAWKDASDEDVGIRQSPTEKIGKVFYKMAIPCGVQIESATLYMTLEPDEGLAYGDKESVVQVREMQSKQQIRLFESGKDFHDKGFNKSNPRTPLDFTGYVKGLYGQE